ncbi:MAG: hypothetical protein ACRDIY_21555 [Chloroflexota bacterium]
MAFIPNETQQDTIRDILARHETAVVVEESAGVEILGVANYPKACREYYVGRLVVAVFRTQFDLEARLALARARAGAT